MNTVPSVTTAPRPLSARDSARRLTPPLLSERMTWIAITALWIVLGLGSWWLEYGLSFGTPEGPMTLGRAAARLDRKSVV